MSIRSTFPRSSVLVLGVNSIQSLVPSTLISQVESLLDSHRIEDATELAEQQLRKLQTKIPIDEDQADELRYAFHRIGFQCFAETRFAEAANSFFNGEVDPRLVISYYPDLRGSLFSPDNSLNVFTGVAERMPLEASVEDIVVTNLVRNYSPHLSPNTREAPTTAELRRILVAEAREKLERFLTRWRTRRKVEVASGAAASEPGKKLNIVDQPLAVVDTVLVKLYAQLEKTEALYNLLQEPHHIVLSEVEPVLQQYGQYSALCILYKQAGEESKLLETWSKLIDGEWTEEDIQDPLSDMITLLTEKRDRTLTQRWGLWIIKRDPERGLKLLMPKDTGKRRERPDEDLALLQSIKEANSAAGVQFLEYLVIHRKSSSQRLHTLLAESCIEELNTALAQESVTKLWRAKASSYTSNRTTNSFLSYFASTTPDSPHKRTRLKAIMFFAGSSLYDPHVIHPLVLEHRKILQFELAILDGKLGNHRSALSTLVHDLHDSTSAELYCTLGGELVSAKNAQLLAETNSDLEPWTSALFGGATRQTAITRQRSTVDEAKKTDLLKILLEVYMSDGEASNRRAAHLINSQAINLDVLDVITLVPPDWPLDLLSSFLARSLRRTTHACYEGKVVKTISAGQNLEVKDRAWLVLREEGMIIEEPAEGDDDDEPVSYDEKQELTEKLALHLANLSTDP